MAKPKSFFPFSSHSLSRFSTQMCFNLKIWPFSFMVPSVKAHQTSSRSWRAMQPKTIIPPPPPWLTVCFWNAMLHSCQMKGDTHLKQRVQVMTDLDFLFSLQRMCCFRRDQTGFIAVNSIMVWMNRVMWRMGRCIIEKRQTCRSDNKSVGRTPVNTCWRDGQSVIQLLWGAKGEWILLHKQTCQESGHLAMAVAADLLSLTWFPRCFSVFVVFG